MTLFRRYWGGIGDEEGVEVVAERVGVLVITDCLAWYCLDIEELFSSPSTILLNLLERFLLRTESRASPHS